MAIVHINKIDAARRQLDASVRMTFGGVDAVAIYAVVSGAHRIIRDICTRRGNIESYLRFTDTIVPGHEKEFWRFWHASANFLKHADKDADDTHELNDEAADFLIVITSKWYVDLGNPATFEMKTFAGWWAMIHPNVLKPKVLAAAGMAEQFAQLEATMAALTREDRLKAGQLMLSHSSSA